jgi:predicted hydrolase (HD superfamily)
VPRDTPLRKSLAACDELTGFISACAFVRPSKAVRDVTPEAVRKKMKDKAFARAVDRQAMLDGAELLGIPFEEHVQFVIDAMTANADALGLQGVSQ